jgi:polyribonucleotide nucleotidyltransferase
MAYQKVEIEFNGQPLTMETGKMARQADGAVVITYGETKVKNSTREAKSLVLSSVVSVAPLSVRH